MWRIGVSKIDHNVLFPKSGEVLFICFVFTSLSGAKWVFVTILKDGMQKKLGWGGDNFSTEKAIQSLLGHLRPSYFGIQPLHSPGARGHLERPSQGEGDAGISWHACQGAHGPLLNLPLPGQGPEEERWPSLFQSHSAGMKRGKWTLFFWETELRIFFENIAINNSQIKSVTGKNPVTIYVIIFF